jgi:hypothetical protein
MPFPDPAAEPISGTEDNTNYSVVTVFDEHSRKITSTVQFNNPDAPIGEKLQIVSHTVLRTREKDIEKALRKLGWWSPQDVKTVQLAYERDLQEARSGK